MDYDILIFVQAAADLRYALDICAKNKGSNIRIVVVNVKLTYEFLITLPLENTTVTFFEYIPFSIFNPYSYLAAKKKLKFIWNKNFENLNFNQVYFFSRFYDWFTTGIIVLLAKKKDVKIYYYDHYDDISVKNIRKIKFYSQHYLKAKIVSSIISFISGAKFTSRYVIKNLEFEFWKYPIHKIHPINLAAVNKNFQYKITGIIDKNILFFLSTEEVEMITFASKLKIIALLFELKKSGYHIYLKGHPRFGLPSEFIKYSDAIIPDHVPSEFVSYENVQFTIGIVSAALAYPATISDNNKVISIINLLEFTNSEKKKFYINYLNELSMGKIEYLKDNDLFNGFFLYN